MSGRVNTAFGRLTNYEWKRIGTCEPTCGATEQTCTRGELIIQYFKVYPKIEELRRTAENCTYTGPWQPFIPVSDNITGKFLRFAGNFQSNHDQPVQKVLLNFPVRFSPHYIQFHLSI